MGVKTDINLLQTVLKVLSLQYRIKFACGGINPLTKNQEDSLLVDQLLKALADWKETISLYISKDTTNKDLEKIKDLSRYTRFIPVLLKSKKIQDDTFRLVFRDNFPIKLLIQYYKTCSVDLKNAVLTTRIGFFNTFSHQKMAIIEKNMLEDGTYEKDLKFFINKKFVSILNDEAEIEMNDGKFHQWKEIKKIWESSKKIPAEMEVFEDSGMLMYRPQGLNYYANGSKVAVDTSKPKFWEGQEIPTFLTISKEKLEQMLDIKITKEKPYVATVEASCIDPFQVKDAHGASTIYLPNEDETLYRAFPFGKYAKDFPQTAKENACFIGNSVKAELTYPDPTPFYSQRLHAASPNLLTKKEAEELFLEYGKNIWYFQFAGNNCSADFQLIFEKMFGKLENGGAIPNYFRKPILESKFFYPVNFIFEPLEALHSSISTLLVHGIHVLCGSKRQYSKTEDNGTTRKVSLYENEFCDNQNLYAPGQLVYRILTGEIEGVTWYGY